MSFAVLRQAAEAASAADGPLQGYPPWLIVAVGTLVAVAVLWIIAKLLKWTLWILLFLVLVGGLAVATKMFLEPPAARPTIAAPVRP